jgi:hypothetical protein
MSYKDGALFSFRQSMYNLSTMNNGGLLRREDLTPEGKPTPRAIDEVLGRRLADGLVRDEPPGTLARCQMIWEAMQPARQRAQAQQAAAAAAAASRATARPAVVVTAPPASSSQTPMAMLQRKRGALKALRDDGMSFLFSLIK